MSFDRRGGVEPMVDVQNGVRIRYDANETRCVARAHHIVEGHVEILQLRAILVRRIGAALLPDRIEQTKDLQGQHVLPEIVADLVDQFEPFTLRIERVLPDELERTHERVVHLTLVDQQRAEKAARIQRRDAPPGVRVRLA